MKIKRFALGTLWTNCYIVWDANNDGVIIDPGAPSEETESFIKDNDIKIVWILLTHGHSDHIGGVASLRNLSENGVAIHYDDADALTDTNKNLSAYVGENVKVAAPDKLLKDGDELTAGSLKISVIHTPGHTEGGVCLLIADGDDKILMSGDTLFARSVGRSDLPGGDEAQPIESLKKLDPLPDKMRVYPGHGPETTIGAEKTYNPYWPR